VRHMSLILDCLDAPPPVKLVALILADHADADGYCWPSQRRIAERGRISERSVRRHTLELIELGVLVKVRSAHMTRLDGRLRHVTNAYRMSAEALEALPTLLSMEPPADDEEAVSGGQTAPDGRPKAVPGGRCGRTPLAAKPSVEPSLSEEHSLSETGVSDPPSQVPKVSARKDVDWEERAEEVLAATAFPAQYRELAKLLAEANKTGRAALSRVVRELYEPLLEVERDVGAEAMRIGLRAATSRAAPNANYVRKAAEGHVRRPASVAVTSRTIDRSDYDDFCTGGEL
ncbi:MAG: helix-turn-helix domain-containing protein, partial [Candidatus Bipolaricaulia bacterium]